MAAVGNLNDYVKFQMAQGMASGNSSAGGFGAEMAVGMAMAQQMMQQPGFAPPAGPPPLPGQAPAASPASSAAGGAGASLLSPAEAAQLLGVSEIDVLATLESGELKGKKIGATWRITRKAIDEFLAS
jgi:excisionase family DNA binding protein